MRNTTLSTHFRSTISSIIFPGPLDVETVIHAICLKLATTGMKPPAECGKYRVVFPPTNFTKTEDSFFCILGVSKLNRILLPALFCLILAAALLGNSLVLTTIVLSKMTWTTMHILTVSLAISDIFLGWVEQSLKILTDSPQFMMKFVFNYFSEKPVFYYHVLIWLEAGNYPILSLKSLLMSYLLRGIHWSPECTLSPFW